MAKEDQNKVILTLNDLVDQFSRCGLEKGQSVIVHTSLGRLGYVVGGAETVIRALLELVGTEGTLLMPSQTWKNLDPSTGVHWEAKEEWWPVIREHWPAYDPEITPAVGMGTVAEMFRKWPGARRSGHPARSFAAVGLHADWLTADHDRSNIFGDGSPLGKLYELDGRILLIGVGHDKNTSLHLAETRARFPSKTYGEESSAILVDGNRQWVTYSTQKVDDSDFVQLGNDYEQTNSLPIHRVGNADVRFMGMRSLVDFATAWMEAHRS